MKNWASSYEFEAKKLLRPGSVAELQRLVAKASKIRAVGNRHSFNGIGDTSGDLINLSAIEPDFAIDAAKRLIWVSAGCSYGALADYLHRHGWALHNLASLPHISIAGAILTATHGSGDKNGTLASSVAAIELVTADGSIRNVRRGDEDFDCMVVGLGAFGVVSKVALDLTPSFYVRQDAFTDLSWDDLLANFDEITGSAYSVSILTKCAGLTVDRIWMKSSAESSGNAAPDLSHLGLTPGSPLGSLHDDVVSPLLNLFGIAGPWSERLAHTPAYVEPTPPDQIQSEYLVARNRFADAVAVIRSMGAEIDPVLHSMEIRTIAADSLWLSPAYLQDTVGLHFTWKLLPNQIHEITTSIERRMLALGARPHWAKIIHADAQALAAVYPRLKEFRERVTHWDPAGKFSNAFLERHIFA